MGCEKIIYKFISPTITWVANDYAATDNEAHNNFFNCNKKMHSATLIRVAKDQQTEQREYLL